MVLVLINGETPLMWAQNYNKTSTVDLIHKHIFDIAATGTTQEFFEAIHSGVSLSVTNQKQQTLLHIAAIRGCFDIVKFLLSQEINVNSTDEDDCSALYYAVIYRHEAIIQLLIDGGCSVNIKLKVIVFDQNKVIAINGNTLLIDVAIQGDRRHVLRLINTGADINATNAARQTALHIATIYNETSIVLMLLSHHANAGCIDHNARTPLHIAAAHGNESIVKQLLLKSPNLNLRDKNGMTPLYLACANGHDQLIPYLITPSNANCGANDVNHSPLYCAAMQGLIHVVKLLLEYEYVQVGGTPLHAATNSGQKAIVTLFLANGALVNQLDENNETPLMIACKLGYDKIAKLYIQNGANVNTIGRNGNTSLHEVAGSNHINLIKMLLKADADPNVTNKNGKTALDIAISKKYCEIINVLQPKEE
ncbi:serine/threonine-protein phosphatase 6 regulatory ankyrin repeat subunit C-like [Thraustotheca clavata]|uniref:Serine/threonine-protein phosphatase 6 regulatory ankyrin repeat subunit C-like n=1 Tax=Thraustotheca clavata TaxID=74557 RepID=A0A1V9ZVN4_9STRA|nr:serine/threonine-protein phosphatase 6 regulatory ankyrin repeat subunit C-like [Thraustotheca clavata]